MAFNMKLDMKWLIIPVAIIIGLGVFNGWQFSKNKELETYKRQLSGQLTEKERELQKANSKIGTLQSQLLSKSDLVEHWKDKKQEVDENFADFVDEHDLQIKSMDRTIAQLEQKIEDGTTETIVHSDSNTCKDIRNCVIEYSWRDGHERFALKDPNIFEENNETFTSKQFFRVYGEIYEQKDGSLQTRRLVLREMHKGSDGNFTPIDGGRADIVDSEFTYSNPPEIDTKWGWRDLFRIRAMALGSVELLPNSGDLKLGLGMEFFQYRFGEGGSLGLGTYTALDFQNAENIAQHLSINYNPAFGDTELNFGIFASIGTPFSKFFNAYQFNTGLVFYLNN